METLGVTERLKKGFLIMFLQDCMFTLLNSSFMCVRIQAFFKQSKYRIIWSISYFFPQMVLKGSPVYIIVLIRPTIIWFVFILPRKHETFPFVFVVGTEFWRNFGPQKPEIPTLTMSVRLFSSSAEHFFA